MSEPMSPSESRCPWCSAALPDAAADKCPSCGAQLIHASGTEPNLPGVTALDPEAILRARSEAGRSRGILGFLARPDQADSGVGPQARDSLAPPDDEVRREMLRLQLEAEQADLVAESVALRADALAERGVHLNQLNEIEEQAEAVFEAEAGGQSATAAAPAPAAPGPAAPAPAAPAAPPAPGAEKPPAG